MTAVASNTTILSSFYKMDNVLYEIRDKKGILKNGLYEPWKAEVIADLEFSGFIKQEGDKYVLTEEGREVINYDSFLYYNKRIKLYKPEKDVSLPVQQHKHVFLGVYFLVFAFFIIATILTQMGYGFEWIENFYVRALSF